MAPATSAKCTLRFVRVVSLVSIRCSPWSIDLLLRMAARLPGLRQYRFRVVRVHGADHCAGHRLVVTLLCAAQYGVIEQVYPSAQRKQGTPCPPFPTRNVSSRSRDKLISRQMPAILL